MISNRSELLAALIICFLLTASGCRPSVPPTEVPATKDIVPVRISAENVSAAEPAIASGPDGQIFTVYVEHGANKAGDVYLQAFDAEQIPVGEKVRVNRTDGQARTWAGDAPTIAAGQDGKIYIGWTAKTDGGTDLMLSVSSDGGKSFGEAVKVNDDVKPASHGMHSLAVDNKGSVYMAWLDERNIKMPEHAQAVETTEIYGSYLIPIHHTDKTKEKAKPAAEPVEPNSEVYFAVFEDGGKTFSANKKVATDVCPCCKTSLFLASDGSLYLSWRQVLAGDFRHIAVASLKNGEAEFSKPVIVSDDKWQINACPISGAALSAGSDGVLNVAWYTAGNAGQAGLYSAESKDGGKTFEPRKLVSLEAIGGTPVLLREKERLITVFGKSGSRTEVSSQGENADPNTIENAVVPAAIVSASKVFTAFVRSEGGKNSVWLSAQAIKH